jgi:hypothetical protein
MGTWHAPPRSRRYAPLSDAAKYPAGARPSKCIYLFILFIYPDAYNVEIQNLAKASQAYDRGLERFVGKFDSSVQMTATMAIEKGCHSDYGVAIFFQQKKRRCLHLGTILCAQSDKEAFWFTMMMWVLFQPRSATPRMEPGQLYCPASATQIVTKYWDYLDNPLRHPDCNESEFTKNAMGYYAEALSHMNLSSFEPAVDFEAPDKSLPIVTQAALSRRKPIQNAPDQWEPRRESAVGLTPLSEPVHGTDSAPRLGSTDTCVAQGNPFYT